MKCQVPLTDGKWPGPQAKEVWVRPKLSRLFWQVISDSPRGAKAHAQRRTGPRGTPRRVTQASLTAPCTALDPLRLKRKGKWCRLDRPLRHGAVIGPLADPRRLGKFLGIARCDKSALLFQVREAISQHKGQHVLDKSASGSLRDQCVQCCDLRAGSAHTTTHKPQSTRPWPDHAPHGCRRPERCKIDSGPDARGLKQPPNQQEVRVDLRCISNMDEDELMLRACLRAEQLLQHLAAVSGKPGLEAITEDQLIQASAMQHHPGAKRRPYQRPGSQGCQEGRSAASLLDPVCYRRYAGLMPPSCVGNVVPLILQPARSKLQSAACAQGRPRARRGG